MWVYPMNVWMWIMNGDGGWILTPTLEYTLEINEINRALGHFCAHTG